MPSLAAFDIPPQVIRDGVSYMVALILSITVHEYGHAKVADYLGDPLPRSQDRVTLNPLAHIDWIGTILFPLIMFISSVAGTPLRLLGWGKPVQISLHPRFIKRGISVRRAHLLIALAGPLMNLIFGAILSVLFVALKRAGVGALGDAVAGFVMMNIGLAFFNLLPCPPLDGGAILVSILPQGNPVSGFLEKWGFAIFMLLLFTGALSFIMIPAQYVSVAWLGQLLHWIR